MKNALITEAETVNAGTKFIVRDTAELGGEHIETVCLAEIEARQRCTPGERAWASPLVSSTVKRQLSHSYRSVLLGLCLPSKPFI